MSGDKPLKERLVDAMADMVNPTKSKEAKVPTKSGGQYTYHYESLDQVLAAVRPPLMERGIGLTQRQVWSEHTSSYALETVVFDGSEEIVLDTRPMRDCPDAQAAGSWETYMRRYALRSAFGLAGEDDDGQASALGQGRSPKGAPTRQHPAADWSEFNELRAAAVGQGHPDAQIMGYLGSLGKEPSLFSQSEVDKCSAFVRSMMEGGR